MKLLYADDTKEPCALFYEGYNSQQFCQSPLLLLLLLNGIPPFQNCNAHRR